MGAGTVNTGTKTITQYGQSDTASIWVDEAIGFKLEKDGTYTMVGDFYHSRGEFKKYYGQNAKFEQELNCAYAIEDVKAKVDELGFTIDENPDFKIGTDGMIRVQAISYF